MRRLSLLLLASALACTSEVAPQNPYDPATPLALQAKARVSGTVTTGAGAPFAQLEVYLRRNGALAGSFTTDDAGAFVFDALTPGSYAVEAQAPGFAPIAVPLVLAAGAEVDVGTLTMTPLGGADTGFLRGSAVLGRKVTTPGGGFEEDPAADHGGILIESVGTPYAAVTTSTGDYELALPPGRHTLRISHPNYIAQEVPDQQVTLGAVSPVLVVILATNPAKVSGQVLGELPGGGTGPLAFATVTLEGTSATGLTNAAGQFTLDQLAPGSYLLRVLADGYATAAVPVLNLIGGETRVLADPLSLVLERGSLRGRVALADSADASGVVVEVTGSGRAVVTGADGAYAFDALVAGSYEVRARREGYAQQVVSGLAVTAGAAVDVPLVTLTRQGGTVVISDGAVTRSRSITLALGAPSAASWRASEDPTFQDAALGDVATARRPYHGPGSTEPWLLTDRDGERVVYVVFHDASDGASAPASAAIVLDRVAPVVPSVVIDADAPFTRFASVGLALSAQDLPDPASPQGTAVSGLARMELADNSAFLNSVQYDFNLAQPWTLPGVGGAPVVDGTKAVWVRFYDRAGNQSAPAHDLITLDRKEPQAPAITLSGGAGVPAGTTGSPLVTATLSATDENEGAGKQDLQVRLSNAMGFAGATWQPYAATVSWLLPPGDGAKTVYVEFMDPAGNVSRTENATITLAGTAPSAGSLTVAGGAAATNQQFVAVAPQAAGAAEMRLFVNGQPVTGWIPYATSATVDLGTTPDEATRLVSVSFRNEAGVEGAAASATIVYDHRAPTAAAVAVDGGAAYTRSATVTLTLGAVESPAAAGGYAAGLDTVELSHDAAFTSPTSLPYTTSAPWTFLGTEGPKTVWARFRDRAGNASDPVSATVVYDQTAPASPSIVLTGSAGAPAGTTGSPVVTAALSASDANDGGAGKPNLQMRLSEDPGFAGAAWQPYAASVAWTLSGADGPKTVHAQFRDAAGNESLRTSAAITLSTTPPSAGSVVVDGGAAATRKNPVTAAISATGAARMLISVNGTPQAAGWVAYAPTATVDLGGVPDETTATVSVAFRNAGGLEGGGASTSILVDRRAPTAGAVTINGGAATTGPLAVTLALSALDVALAAGGVASGLDTVELSNDGFATVTAVPMVSSLSWTLAAGADGPRTVSARFKDKAGNVSATATASIVVDVTAPANPTVSLSGGAAAKAGYTGSPVVTATLSATDLNDGGAGKPSLQMRLSSDSGFAGASWQPFSATASVSLPGGDGLKTVYAQFRDAAGNTSATATATITLAASPPSNGSVSVAAATSLSTVTATLSATGADRMLISVNGIPQAAGWIPYATTASVDLGANPDEATRGISVLFRNAGGVDGAAAATSIVVDRTPPTVTAGSVSISGGTAFTGSLAVTVSLAASDGPVTGTAASGLAWVELSNDGVTFTRIPWATTVAWTLPDVADGARTVTARVVDRAGNVSGVASDTIVLDRSGPSGTSITLAGNAGAKALYTGTPVVTATVGATDPSEGTGKKDLQVRLGSDSNFSGANWQPYATALSFVLPVGDGPKEVWVQFKDGVGNVSTPIFATINLMETPPSAGTIAVAGGAAVTRLTTVPATVSAVNADRMLVYVNGVPQPAGWVAYATSATVDLSAVPTESTATVSVVFRNAGGIDGGDALTSVLVDRTAPTSPTVSVNGGAAWAGSRTVTLSLAATDGPSSGAAASGLASVEISNDGFATFQSRTYASTVTWDLVAGPPDGLRTVSVRFLDKAGNVSAAPHASASILLDTTGPAVTAFTLAGNATARAGYTGTPLVTANVAATDANGGAANANLQVRLGHDPTFAGSAWQSYATSLSWTLQAGDGPKQAWVQFRDAVGNLSAPTSAAITLLEAPPTAGSIAVAGGAAATNQASVTATLQASNADRVLLYVDGVPQAAGWIDLTGSATVDLGTTPNEATRTVSALFRSAGGVDGAAALTSIVYDRTPPTGSRLVIAGDAAYSGSVTVSLSIAASDGPATGTVASGLDTVELSNDGFATFQSKPYASTVSWDLAAGSGGARTVSARFRDKAGNVSLAPHLSDDITYDRLAPTVPSITLAGNTTADTGYTGTPVVTATLSATDENEGTAKANLEVRVANDSSFLGAAWQPYVASMSWVLAAGDGPKTVYAQFRDAAGNTSTVASASIQLLTAPPAGGSIVLDGGRAATSSLTTSANVSASGAYTKQFSVNGVAVTGWIPYASNPTAVSLASVTDSTTASVTVSFRNRGGVEGGGASAAIRFDRTAPLAGFLAITGTLGNGSPSAAYTTTPAVLLQVTPPGADEVEMAVAQAATDTTACADAFPTPLWQPVSRNASLVLTGIDGDYKTCVLFRDAAGNFDRTRAAEAMIKLDTTPPTNPSFTNLVSTTQSAPTAPTSGKPTVSASTDTGSGGVHYQCTGGTGSAYGATWVDCGTGTTLPLAFSLASNTQSTLGVRARDAAYNYSPGSFVQIVHDDVKPMPPNVTGLETTRDSLSITWDASPDADVVSYRVHYGNFAGDFSGTGAAQGPSPVTVPATGQAGQGFALTGLTTSYPYYVAVEAVDRAGNLSGPSGQRFAQPNDANPRLLSTYGGLQRSVGVRTAGTGRTFAYVMQNQGVVQMDVTAEDQLPSVTGRASLPNFVPDSAAPVVVFDCSRTNRGGVVVTGHCVVTAGSTLEGDFRGDGDSYRAPAPVVFFPVSPGGAGTILTVLPARPHRVVMATVAGQPVLLTVERSGVKAFDMTVVKAPRLLASSPLDLQTVSVAGEAWGVGGQSLLVYAPVRTGTLPNYPPTLYAFDLANVWSGSFTKRDHGWLYDPSGNLMGWTVNPIVPIIGDNQFYIAWNDASGTWIGEWSPGTATPWDWQHLSDPTAGDPDNRPIAGVAGNMRVYVFTDQPPAMSDPPSGPYVYQVYSDGGMTVTGSNSALNTEAQSAALAVYTATQGLGTSSDVEHLFAVDRDYSGNQTVRRWSINDGTGAITYNPRPFQEVSPTWFAESDRFVFIAETNRIYTLDVANPLFPKVVDTYDLAADFTKLQVHGRHLYALSSAGVHILRMDGNGKLTAAGMVSIPMGYTLGDFVVRGRYLYLAMGWIRVYDVSTPSAPVYWAVTAGSVGCGAIDARPAVSGGTTYEAILYCGITGDYSNPDRFQTFTFNGGGVAALSAAITLPNDNGYYHPKHVTVRGTTAVVTNVSGSHVVDVSTPGSPYVTSNLLPVSGPVLFQGGYVVGLGKSGAASGPDFLQQLNGALDGTLLFSTCGVDSGGHGSLASTNGVYYASCQRNGVSVFAAPARGGGSLLLRSDVSQAWVGQGSPLATDGVYSYLAGPEYPSEQGRLYSVDGRYNPTATPQNPYYTTSNATPGGSSANWFLNQDGVLHAFDAFNSVWSLAIRALVPSPVYATWPSKGSYTVPAVVGTPNGAWNTQPVSDGEIAWVSRNNYLESYDLRGTPAYRNQVNVGAMGALALARDRLYAGSATSGLIRIYNTSAGTFVGATNLTVSGGVTRITGLAVQGSYLFVTFQTNRVDPYGLAVFRLGDNRDGNLSSEVVRFTSQVPLGNPTVAGDVLYVTRDLGLATYDLSPLWLDAVPPVLAGATVSTEPASVVPRFIVDGPWGYLLGNTFRTFDLRQ